MNVKHLRKGKLDSNASTVKELLEETNESEETVVVSVNGQIVVSDFKLNQGDEVKMIPVVSGG